MNDLLKPVPSEEVAEFQNYCLDWFDGTSSPYTFARFKRIARCAYNLWDSWDPLDYEAVKCLCSPRVIGPAKIALVCYNHNEIWFREEVMTWAELAPRGEGMKPDDLEDSHLYTRNGCYRQC